MKKTKTQRSKDYPQVVYIDNVESYKSQYGLVLYLGANHEPNGVDFRYGVGMSKEFAKKLADTIIAGLQSQEKI